MDGWVKLHRKLLDNPIVMKDSDHLAVWTYLLLKATHDNYSTLFGGKKIILESGQLITGCDKIASDLNISNSKARRILNSFQSDGQIDRQAKRYGSLITLLNWNLYQKSDGQIDAKMTDERQTSDRRVTAIQECKNDKNVKNNISRHKYGEYKNVLLSDAELEKLKAEFPNDYLKWIDKLSCYMASKGTSYKNHLATIRNWAKKDNKAAFNNYRGKIISDSDSKQRSSYSGEEIERLLGYNIK